MKTILVCKGGSVFGRKNSVGEAGETEGVLRHLLERNDCRIVYYGLYRGEVLPGLTVIEPDVAGLNENSSGREQDARFALDAKRLAEFEPIVGFIQTAGYSPTFSMIDNPRGARVQGCAVRSTAPMHYALNHFKIPRVVINNDPRTYPRDQEMSMGWPYSRPVAMLDQCDKSFHKVVGGKSYHVTSVHARAESWAYHEYEENTNDRLTCVLAHAHLVDGIGTGSTSAWDAVFADGFPDRCRVYGRGWEGYRLYNTDVFKGEVSQPVALEMIKKSVCCPVVSHTPGFYTGKPYVLMSRGCIPLLLGNHRYAWDPKELFIPMQSTWRIGSYKKLATLLWENEDAREQMRILWRELLQPDWRMLDEVVDKLLLGEPLVGYGGYN